MVRVIRQKTFLNACSLASARARRTGMVQYVYQDKNYEWRVTMHRPTNWKVRYFSDGRSEIPAAGN